MWYGFEVVPHKGNVSLEIVLELGEPVRAVLIGRLSTVMPRMFGPP